MKDENEVADLVAGFFLGVFFVPALIINFFADILGSSKQKLELPTEVFEKLDEMKGFIEREDELLKHNQKEPNLKSTIVISLREGVVTAKREREGKWENHYKISD